MSRVNLLLPAIQFTTSLLGLLVLLLPIASTHAHVVNQTQFEEFHVGWNNTVRQTRQQSCGPALVATLAQLTGAATSEYEVLTVSTMTNSGISLAEFQRLMGTAGFPGRWYEGDWLNLTSHQTAIAAHFDGTFGHFVGILTINEPYIFLIDPNRGRLLMHRTAFLDQWSGYYYAL